MGRVLAILFVVGALLGGASCKRPCETSQNCKRTCQCVDAQTSSRTDCTLAFRCDGATQVCEDDYDGLSCNDICSQYAAKGQCGFERCATDPECTKNLSCPVHDAQGAVVQGQAFDCTLTFACDQTQQLCAVESTLSNDALCANCPQPGT